VQFRKISGAPGISLGSSLLPSSEQGSKNGSGFSESKVTTANWDRGGTVVVVVDVLVFGLLFEVMVDEVLLPALFRAPPPVCLHTAATISLLGRAVRVYGGRVGLTVGVFVVDADGVTMLSASGMS
jgi:hypothetical protein